MTVAEARFSAHQRLGIALESKGDYEGALAAYQTALNIAEAQSQKDPNNVDGQKEILSAHLHHADALIARGDNDAALAELRQALTLGESLSRREPDHRYLQESVALAHVSIAMQLLAQKDAAQAAKRGAARY
ncbi:tetratricopeptide repeat protein [Paraburkholderia sp. BL9I2N2]|nr:tetratricopeptide repeat protein [Paraburkholderia sp. BL9I2N2]